MLLCFSIKMRKTIKPRNKPLMRQRLEDITKNNSTMKGSSIIPRNTLKKQQKTKARPYL